MLTHHPPQRPIVSNLMIGLAVYYIVLVIVHSTVLGVNNNVILGLYLIPSIIAVVGFTGLSRALITLNRVTVALCDYRQSVLAELVTLTPYTTTQTQYALIQATLQSDPFFNKLPPVESLNFSRRVWLTLAIILALMLWLPLRDVLLLMFIGIAGLLVLYTDYVQSYLLAIAISIISVKHTRTRTDALIIAFAVFGFLQVFLFMLPFSSALFVGAFFIEQFLDRLFWIYVWSFLLIGYLIRDILIQYGMRYALQGERRP